MAFDLGKYLLNNFEKDRLEVLEKRFNDLKESKIKLPILENAILRVTGEADTLGTDDTMISKLKMLLDESADLGAIAYELTGKIYCHLRSLSKAQQNYTDPFSLSGKIIERESKSFPFALTEHEEGNDPKIK